MKPIPYSHIEKGTFLVATPEVEQGLFFRSVVLVCEHNTTGSFGLIINKKLTIDLPEDVLSSGSIQNPRASIQTGGPLQTNQMMLLHSSPTISEQTLKVTEGVYLGGDLQFLQEAVSNAQGPDIRLCFGYTGWGAGHLEREFLDGSWYLAPASAKYVFHPNPEKVWQLVLREMGGKYAALSMIPEDLSLN
jgi:putative transcriptional regulator